MDTAHYKIILDNISEHILLINSETYQIEFGNRAFLTDSALSSENIEGKKCFFVTHGNEIPCFDMDEECPIRIIKETGTHCTIIHDHSGKLIEISAFPVKDEKGELQSIIEIMRDITGEKELEGELKEKKRLLEELLHTCPDGIIANDRTGNIFLFNSGSEKVFGYKSEEVLGKIHVRDLYHEEEAKHVKEILYGEEYGRPGIFSGYETHVVNSSGEEVPIRLSGTLLTDEEGKEIGTVGFFHDLSERRRLEAKLRESEKQFRSIFKNVSDAIVTCDEIGEIILSNNAVESLFGRNREEFEGKNIRSLMAPVENAKPGLDVAGQLRNIAGRSIEWEAQRKSGERMTVMVSISEIDLGERIVYTLIMRDVTPQKVHEEELRVLSITDEMTGLYNRRHFYSLAEKIMALADRTGKPFTVIILDIDNFKSYNDTYGHLEGDKVIKKLAETLKRELRTMDSSFRYGGEEFLLLLPDTDEEGGCIVAERVRKAFHNVLFTPQGSPVRVSLSIGVAKFRKGFSLDETLRCADLAMYQAKNRGKNRTILYGSEEDNSLSRTNQEDN